MRVIEITAICVVAALGTYASTSQANPENSDHRWMPKQPSNTYWQTPNWSGFQQPPAYNSPPPPSASPMYNSANQAPPPAPAYRSPQGPGNYPGNYTGNYPAPYANNPNNQMNRGAPFAPDSYRGYPPPPRGPYGAPSYGPDNGASAYNLQGSHRYRTTNFWNNNKFWGRSGPSTWMNPNKRNMERGWDDMINSPSRMGEMPGGWTAPEVSMPNPIDVGDQMQDNVKDLPEQMRDMDVGN